MSSSTSEHHETFDLFAEAYGDEAVITETSGHAWVAAMVDVEAALARAGAAVGLIPAQAATAIVAACVPGGLDLAALAHGAGTDGTPVISLVSQLRARLPDTVDAVYVHRGATSQDVIDTAATLVARRSVAAFATSAGRVTAELAALAVRHRDTPQVGRSLLQHGAVTTFGLACAVRLVAVRAALEALDDAIDSLPAQLGGAVGTLASGGIPLLEAFAAELGLPAPVTPWHVTRGPVARLATSAGVLAGELAGVATDLVLLASTEIGEVTPGRPGGSSAMPHKQNASQATLALACAHRVPGLVGTVLAGMPQMLQRDAGRWQAEWGTLTQVLRLLGGTARHTVAALDGVHVHADRMREHVDELLAATGGALDVGAAGELVDRALEDR